MLGWDLNRNFPDYFEDNLRFTRRAKEVQAVMQWGRETQFVISANFHDGGRGHFISAEEPVVPKTKTSEERPAWCQLRLSPAQVQPGKRVLPSFPLVCLRTLALNPIRFSCAP